MDLERELRLLSKSGEYTYGMKSVMAKLRSGDTRMLIISSNCPEDDKLELENLAKLSNVPYTVVDATALQLGSYLGRPHTILSLTVEDPGNSAVLDLVKS